MEDIDAKYGTVRNLLLAVVQKENRLGRGNTASVYAFDNQAPDFFPFAVRTEPRATKEAWRLIKKLPETTRLTPARPGILSEINVGQPLLTLPDDTESRLEDLSIIVRQPGRSLAQWHEQLLKKEGKSHVATGLAMLEPVLRNDLQPGARNPLLSLFDHLYRLNSHYVPEYDPEDILLDKKSGQLSLVDQFAESATGNRKDALNAMGGLRRELLDSLTPPEADKEIASQSVRKDQAQRYQAQRDRFIELVDDAYTTTIHRYAKKEPTPLVFKKIAAIEGVFLNDPPSKLLLQLRRWQSELKIPQRV